MKNIETQTQVATSGNKVATKWQQSGNKCSTSVKHVHTYPVRQQLRQLLRQTMKEIQFVVGFLRHKHRHFRHPDRPGHRLVKPLGFFVLGWQVVHDVGAQVGPEKEKRGKRKQERRKQEGREQEGKEQENNREEKRREENQRKEKRDK
jgi:hypothetical protein